jgi:transposase InsO family protein
VVSHWDDDWVGGVGDSYDNALAESVIGLFKTEVIRRRGPWKNLESVEYATLEWVDWFNNRRLLEPLTSPRLLAHWEHPSGRVRASLL